MPTTIRMPISAVIEKPWPAAISASTMPTSDTGIVNSMTKGSRSDLNCDAMIMNTTMIGQADGEPEAGEGGAHQVDLADEAERHVARVAGRPASLCSSSRGGAADVAPLGLHQHVRRALQLVSLDGDRPDASAGSCRRRPA